MVENAKIEKLKCDILSDFQTLCQSKPLPLEWDFGRKLVSFTFVVRQTSSSSNTWGSILSLFDLDETQIFGQEAEVSV